MRVLNAEKMLDGWRGLLILATYEKARLQAEENVERAMAPLREKYRHQPGTPLPQDRACTGSLTA